MTRTQIDDTLQWAGTVCLLAMYVLMNYFRDLHPADSIAGAMGGMFYLIWTIRMRNKPQALVNLVGITFSVGGVLKSLT